MSKSRQQELMDMYVSQGMMLEDVFDIIIGLEHIIEDLRSQVITQEQNKTQVTLYGKYICKECNWSDDHPDITPSYVFMGTDPEATVPETIETCPTCGENTMVYLRY